MQKPRCRHSGSIGWASRCRKVVQGALALPSMLAFSHVALAADPGRGEQLALQWCRDCHLTGPNQTNGTDAAPPFAVIAKAPVSSGGDLRAWLADPHPPMPKLDLTVREIDDLVAYIESLGDE